MKAIEQYFHVVLFIMLCKVVQTFKSVDKTLGVTIRMKLNEQYFPQLLFASFFNILQNDGIGICERFELWHISGRESVKGALSQASLEKFKSEKTLLKQQKPANGGPL